MSNEQYNRDKKNISGGSSDFNPGTTGRALIRIPDQFRVVLLDPGYLEEIMALQELVFSRLTDKAALVCISQEDYLEILGENGLAMGILHQGQLIAYYGALFPGMLEENYGRDLGLPEEALKQVCHLENSFVHPDYTGKMLQPALGQRVFAAVEALGRYRYFLATVGPNNPLALKSVFKLGLYAVRLKLKYQGLWRFILIKDLQRPLQLQQEDQLAIHNTDIGKKLQLLSQGYCGFRQVEISGKPAVLYAKKP